MAGDPEPGGSAGVVLLAAVEDDEEYAPLGEEVPVGLVHDLLPTEVPDVELRALVLGRRPGRHPDPMVDPFGLLLIRIRPLPLGERPNERRLPHGLIPQDNKLRLPKR